MLMTARWVKWETDSVVAVEPVEVSGGHDSGINGRRQWWPGGGEEEKR